ncbi:MAG: hypothetical protein KDK07_16060 [Bauldia sp.]|nr:hypothetical protein [Bauldia sp.]
MQAILSTYTALVRVDIDLDAGHVETTTIDRGKGIYFGVTRAEEGYLVAARNLDIDRVKRDPSSPIDAIYWLDPGLQRMAPLIEHPVLYDLHQIRAWGRTLFVILGRGSALALFDIPSRRLRGVIDLASAVPDDVPRRAPINGDAFHMNSLSFANGRLFVLAHNWDQPSFALEFALPRLPWPGTLSRVAVHRSVGSMAHDIMRSAGALHVLDSGAGRLLIRRSDGRERIVSLASATGRAFPRGLSLTRSHIVIGCGQHEAERALREVGPTRIVVLDRKTLEVRLDARIGDYGNPADILVTSEPDLTDRKPSPRTRLPRRFAVR